MHRVRSPSPDTVTKCRSCGSDLAQTSATAVALAKLRANPRVLRIRLMRAADSCPACQLAEGEFPKDSTPDLPIPGCSHPHGCRCFYAPALSSSTPELRAARASAYAAWASSRLTSPKRLRDWPLPRRPDPHGRSRGAARPAAPGGSQRSDQILAADEGRRIDALGETEERTQQDRHDLRSAARTVLRASAAPSSAPPTAIAHQIKAASTPAGPEARKYR
jgi:hypothetical protein